MVQGAPQTAGRYAEEVRAYKAPPPEVSTEQFYETDPDQGLPARLLDPVRVAAADHLRRARRRPGTLGRRPARVHARLRPLGDVRCAVRVPSPTRQPRDARGRDRSPRAPRREVQLFDVRQRPTRSSTPPRGSWRRSIAPPARKRPSRSTGTRISSAAAAWATTNATASSTRPALVRRAEPVRHRRQRAADARQRESGADDHGARRTRRGANAPWRLTPPEPIRALDVRAYRVPTERPEADGTFGWDSTTVVVVAHTRATTRGLGFSYAPERPQCSIDELLADVIVGRDAARRARRVARHGRTDPQRRTSRHRVDGDRRSRHRPVGSQGPAPRCPAASGCSAPSADAAPVYGSGGFTSYTDERAH